MAVMEAAISSSLAHPNVVATYTYSIKPVRDTTTAALIDPGIIVMTSGSVSGGGGGGSIDTSGSESSLARVHSYEVCVWGSVGGSVGGRITVQWSQVSICPQPDPPSPQARPHFN